MRVREPSTARDRAQVATAVLLVGAAWGVMYALYPVGLQRSGPFWLAALRFDAFVLGVLVVALLARVRLRAPASARDWSAVAAYAGLNVVLHNVALMAGSQHVPVAFVAMTTGLSPLVTILLGRMFLGRTRLTPAALLGFVAGFAGVALLALQGGADGGSVPWMWAIVVFGGVVAWSAGSVALKAAASDLPPLSLALWSSLLGALALQTGALVLEPLPRFDLPYVGTVAFAGLIGGLGAFLLWNGVVREFGPHRANLASYVSPVAASITAWIVVDQALRPVHAVAYALVAFGLTLAVVAGPRAAAPPPSE